MTKDDMLQARANWASRWPNHCRKCEGRGGIETQYDPSPPGISLSAGWMYELELCETCQCVDPARCPRCGVDILDWQHFQEDETPCPYCGWDWGNGPDDVMPEINEW